MNFNNLFHREYRFVSHFWIFVFIQVFFSGNIFTQTKSDFEEIRKGVVQIRVYSQGLDFYSPWLREPPKGSTGTGFLIGNNQILTNAHVVSNGKFIQVQRYNQTEWYEVDVKYIGHDCDLAILQAKDSKFYEDEHIFEFGPIPELNSPIIVVGYPMGGDKISVSRGIVSRKDQSTYSHSEIDSHLVIQVDAAINPGNSGGPAIQDNKVVGVAFQVASKGENIGYLIPTTVIKYFLEDVKDGKYDGYVELGVRTINSYSSALRAYKKIPDNYTGVFVTKVFKGGSAENFLKKGDFLLEIDKLPIGNNGTVMLDHDSRVDFVEVVDNKHSGEMISFKFFRDGKEHNVRFPAKRMVDFDFMRNSYEDSVDYFVLGGLVFQNVSRNLLSAWSKNGDTQGGSQLHYRFFYFLDDDMNRDVESDVVLYRKLSHPINSSSDYFVNMIVESVNGKLIKNISDLKNICQSTTDKFIRIQFRDIETPLILNKKEVEEANTQIRKVYNLED
ncbi:MAG: trypsin-like peptidase domain-containing protein [Leptospiraceae bacterium]|nr:trypsin-like peptidase domain-containing protein [Leptospiraceae bacterium]